MMFAGKRRKPSVGTSGFIQGNKFHGTIPASSNNDRSKVTLYKTLSPSPKRKHSFCIRIPGVQAGENRTSQMKEGHSAAGRLEIILAAVDCAMRSLFAMPLNYRKRTACANRGSHEHRSWE